MQNHWLLSPQYFETHELALSAAVPEDCTVNGPHDIADRDAECMAALHRPIKTFVEDAAREGARAVSVAGDCCAAVPVLAGLQASGIEPALVWIDAHGDFNTPETSPSQFLGGMPLAMMVGRGPQWMCEAVGLHPIPEEQVWLIDGRDLDPLEREALDASAVRRTGIAGLGSLELDAPVHLHIDMDVIDADECPAFNYPVSGGPKASDCAAALSAFVAKNKIAAISVSGWTGALDWDGCTSDACKDLLQAALGNA